MLDQKVLSKLNEHMGIQGQLRFEEGAGGLTRALLTTERGDEAELYLHGAHVTRYTPAGSAPLLWVSDQSWFEDGKPIRGGVPICFPWFADHKSDPDLPGHGFARLRRWKVRSSEALDDGGVNITLMLKQNEASREMWSNDFVLTMSVTLGESLSMTLGVLNTNPPGEHDAFTCEMALHTYLAVSDVKSIFVEGLKGCQYIDKTDEMKLKEETDEAISFTEETDRMYVDTQSSCKFKDPRADHTIVVDKKGSDTTVVWNPWVAKAARMADFGNDEWPRMVCIETANAGPNAVTLRSGERHDMTATLRVER